MKLFMSILIFFSSLFLAFVSLEGKRGLEEGRSLYMYAAVVFYLLYICFGMEEGTFLELLCMYLSVYLRVRTSIYILGICVSFLASYMCTVGKGLDCKQEYIIYSGFIQIDTLGGGHIMEDIARREWLVSLSVCGGIRYIILFFIFIARDGDLYF